MKKKLQIISKKQGCLIYLENEKVEKIDYNRNNPFLPEVETDESEEIPIDHIRKHSSDSKPSKGVEPIYNTTKHL